MSALLLDTHIWLWYAEGDVKRLPHSGVKKLDQARHGEGVRISASSLSTPILPRRALLCQESLTGIPQTAS
jgi:hypothetical protein